MFEYCAKEILIKSIEGYNGTIFAYGQTGSGKTFTMSGSPNNFNYRGIIPRSITRLFQEIGGKPEFEFVVRVSYLEIYNESLYDLLSNVATYEQKGEISLQEDTKGNLIIKGLKKHIVNNEEEAFNLLFEGEANRTISEHQLNKNSTRSHCIFSVYLEMKSRIESNEKVITSKLNFVDLAGSERVKKTGSTGITLKEATYINKSLTFLEQVAVALSDKSSNSRSKEYIPYRQSKLTHLLKDSIGGNCRTVMIATVWPEEPYLFETLSTLNFAKRMNNVVNELAVNIQLDTTALLKKYRKEIKELKQELAMHNTLANRGRINYDPYQPDEQYQQQLLAKKYLIGESEEMEFDSVRQAKELFTQCRFLFQKYCVNNRDLISDSSVETVEKRSTSNNLNIRKSSMVITDGVGEEEIKPSFGIGKAAKDAKPINKRKNIYNLTVESSGKDIPSMLAQEKQEERNLKQMKEIENKQVEEKIDRESIPDKNTAFFLFKSESSSGSEIEGGIKQNSNDLKIKKEEAKEFLEMCNNHKTKIEELRVLLNEKKLNKLNLGDEMTNVIDEEECKLIADLKGVKEAYKECSDRFKNTKTEIIEIKSNLDILKVKYVEEFETWFFRRYGIRVEEHELKMSKVSYFIINFRLNME